MIPALPRPVATSAEAWGLMQKDFTLRQVLMTRELIEQLHKDILEIEFETHKRGNAAYYVHARIELALKRTDEIAEKYYDTCCEIWAIQERQKCPAFYRAVSDHCLPTLFAARRSALTGELRQRDKRQGRPGKSNAALAEFARALERLRAEWNTKLEIAARDNEHKERAARERETLLPSAQMRSAPAVMNREGDGKWWQCYENRASPRKLLRAFTWKALESRSPRISDESRAEILSGVHTDGLGVWGCQRAMDHRRKPGFAEGI